MISGNIVNASVAFSLQVYVGFIIVQRIVMRHKKIDLQFKHLKLIHNLFIFVNIKDSSDKHNAMT